MVQLANSLHSLRILGKSLSIQTAVRVCVKMFASHLSFAFYDPNFAVTSRSTCYCMLSNLGYGFHLSKTICIFEVRVAALGGRLCPWLRLHWQHELLSTNATTTPDLSLCSNHGKCSMINISDGRHKHLRSGWLAAPATGAVSRLRSCQPPANFDSGSGNDLDDDKTHARDHANARMVDDQRALQKTRAVSRGRAQSTPHFTPSRIQHSSPGSASPLGSLSSRDTPPAPSPIV